MTIVRRDPASGAQWNVATVSQIPSTLNPSAQSQDLNDRILLEITASGYEKFLPPKRPPYHPPPASFGTSSTGGPDLSWKDFAYKSEEEEGARWEARRRDQLRADSRQFGMDDWIIEDDQRPLDEPEDRVFRREMSLEGVGFWSRVKGIGHHRKAMSQDGGHASGGDEKKKEKTKKRGYVFEALWGASADGGTGRCGFKDEGAGKFLKVLRPGFGDYVAY